MHKNFARRLHMTYAQNSNVMQLFSACAACCAPCLFFLGERALAYIFSSSSASAAKCDRRVTRLPLMQQEDQQNHHESVAFGAWAEHKVGRLPRKLSRSDLARKPYYNIKEKQAAGLSLGITTRDTAWR